MKELLKTITAKEWRWVAIFSVMLIVLTTAPYVYGWLVAVPGMQYTGVHTLSPGDIPVYYSYINQVKAGHFFVQDYFTLEPQRFGTFNAWWTWVGLMARWGGMGAPLAFHVARILTIPVFMVVAYLFVSFFVASKTRRWLTMFFLLFSAGLGAYFSWPIDALGIDNPQFYSWPIDLWLTEAITFMALFQSSHFVISITLTLLIFLLMLLAFERQRAVYAIISGVLALWYFNFHPYYLPTIYGTVGLYLFVLIVQASRILWRQVWYYVVLIGLSLPSAGYHVWLITHEPVIAQRAAQNVTNISGWPYVLYGYGLLIPGFLLGLYFLWRQKKFNNHWGFLLLWGITNVLLIYSPFPFHSRYTQGLQVILVLFTVYGLCEWYSYLMSRTKPALRELLVNNKTLWVMLFLLLFAPSVIYNMTRDYYLFTFKPGVIFDRLYLPQDFYRAAAWIQQQNAHARVLSAPLPAYFLPSEAGAAVYLAHSHETLDYRPKAVWLSFFFYDNKNHDTKQQLLAKNKIDYVLYGWYEKRFGDFDPEQADYLRLVFDTPNTKVYQFIPPQ